MAEQALSVFPSASRSIDADSGEETGLSPTSPLRIAARLSVGNWPCACGQVYRVLTEPLTFWPKNSRRGFRVEPADTCVSCGAELEDAFALEAAYVVSGSLLRD